MLAVSAVVGDSRSDLRLFFSELFSTHIGGFFGMDVIVSALVLFVFIGVEGDVWPFGISGFPVVAYLRSRCFAGLSTFLVYAAKLKLEAQSNTMDRTEGCTLFNLFVGSTLFDNRRARSTDVPDAPNFLFRVAALVPENASVLICSVIIPAFNEEGYLGETLASLNRAKAYLQGARGLRSEIIVVDNDGDEFDGECPHALTLGATVARETQHNVLEKVRNTAETFEW